MRNTFIRTYRGRRLTKTETAMILTYFASCVVGFALALVLVYGVIV